ncbi:hypothetical protein BY996DRAFT_7130326 [Phakopsora pachyrhizi]|nr:hypothetical protein BY996DRAFT_7130326 [Phakopsora pachyrhizi]
MPVQDNRLNNRILTDAQNEVLEVKAIEPKVSRKPNGAVTEALKNTLEIRNDLKFAYQNIQNNFNILQRNQEHLSPPIMKNIEETLEYISILNHYRLQEVVATEAKYSSVRIEPIGDLEMLKHSDVSIEVIKKITLTNLKELTKIDTFDNVEIFYSRLILSMVEYLLQQKFITFQENSSIFSNEGAQKLLVKQVMNLLYQNSDFFSLVFSEFFLNSLVNPTYMPTITFIIQNLEAREKKYLIAGLLRCLFNFYNSKNLIQDSKMQVLNESYETLTNDNYNIEDWLKTYENFRFINNTRDQADNYLYNLFIFHFLETHVKFNPKKFSEEVVKEVVTYRKNFEEMKYSNIEFIFHVYVVILQGGPRLYF